MKKEKEVKKSNVGRPHLYGEETESMSFAVPKSKKPYLVNLVRTLLKSYEIKK